VTQHYRRHLDDRQIQRRWLDPRLSSVRVADVQAYLIGKNWKPVPSDSPDVLVFQEPAVGEDGPLYQWLPASEQGCDYIQRIYELIAAIAEVEDRYAGDVLTDILDQRATSTPANGPGVAQKTDTATR
jgi:hypothetical protein